jgi:hypothetical protein
MIFYTHERNYGCRITEYLYKGLRTITLENELLRVGILADKGSDIFEFLYKPLDVDFMWRSPWGVRNPATFVPTSHTGASSFLDFYEGGWQECLPTGGAAGEYQGLPFGAHGEVATIPWDYQISENTVERIAVKFSVRTYRTPFLIEKEIGLERGKPVLTMRERVINEGRVAMHLMWGHHPAFGAPFLDERCVIDLPGGKVHCAMLSPNTRFIPGIYDWPLVPDVDGTMIDLRRVGSVENNTSDTIRINQMPASWYAITNTQRQVGFGLAWSPEIFPALWFWQVYGGAYGPPWYGRTYNIALEPFSTIQPNLTSAIQNGSAHLLEPGQSIQARITAVAFAGVGRVNQISLQGDLVAHNDAPKEQFERLGVPMDGQGKDEQC